MNERILFKQAAKLYYVDGLPLAYVSREINVSDIILVGWFYYGRLPSGMTDSERIKVLESCRKPAKNKHKPKKPKKSFTTTLTGNSGSKGRGC